MELEIGLRVPSTGVRADIVLTAPDGARLDEVTPALLSCVLPPGSTGALSVDGLPLPRHAVVGAPPLVRGALLDVDRPAVTVSPAELELRCTGGPDAGGVWPLRAGHAVVVGRGAGAHVRVDDPRLSREHCRLVVASDVTVADLGTTNGTSLGGVAIGREPVPLEVGAVLHAGSSRFAVCAATDAPAAATGAATADGGVAWHRPPRLREPVTVVEVDVPAPLPDRERTPLPVLAVLAPLVVGVVMWRALGNAAFLLLSALSPVLVVGGVVTERRSGRRRSRRQQRAWERERATAERRLAEAVRTDEQRRRTAWPDPASTALTARGPGARLWERRRDDDDVLTVALGRADLDARVRARGDVPADAATARDVPVVVPLAAVGVLGLAGTPPDVRALARWVVVQAAVWHSPRDVQVVVLTDGAAAAAWEWVRWLPHARSSGDDCRARLGLGVAQAAARVRELVDLVAARHAGAPVDRQLLVVVDGARALRDVPGLARVLADGPAVGVVAVALDREAQRLPAECAATAVVDAAGRLDVHTGELTVLVDADGVSVELAETTARALAPLHDGGGDRGEATDLPASVRWSDLVGLALDGGPADADHVLQRWQTDSPSTTALLGAGRQGPFSVDLRTDGPHALVAGATGSGKSELLQTLLASLALSNRPDELHVLLVDYKGGAAFGPCAGLPHVAGLVTDLDDAHVTRALASLSAELRRRERVLADAGAKDVDELRRRTTTEGRLPRLLIVVDEFASLAEELPEFVAGLVGVAMRGRSLGVHLVLATQRPGGVVSADIRANTNLRLCLAVARDVDSRDVLDSPVAAQIPRTAPGRAYVRTGHTSLEPVQVARIGGRRPAPRPVAAGVAAVVLPAADLGEPRERPVVQRHDDSDLSLLVEACASASARLGLARAAAPWLPPLPAVVDLRDVPKADTGRAAVPYGLLDLPEAQARATLHLDLDGSAHLLVVGAARSGRTTALRTLAASLAATAPAADVHVHVVDAAGCGLAPLADLPHVGAVVCRGDTDRLERLLGWLTGEVRARLAALSASGAGSLAEQRAAAPPGEALPHLLLMLDGWEAFLGDHQDRDAGRLVEQVHALLREGPAAGVHAVVTCGRAGLTGRLPSLLDRRLVLRLADASDYALAGLALGPGAGRGRVPAALPAGRGWLVHGQTATTAQVAVLSGDTTGPAQTAALSALAAAVPAAPPGRGPRAFSPLPTRVRLAELAEVAEVAGLAPAPAGPAVVLGAGPDAPVTVGLGAECPGMLVAGPPGSGRSTALLTVAAGLHARGLPLVAVAPRASPLRQLAGCLADSGATGELAARLASGPCALLVDDAELLVDSPLAPVLEAAVRRARDAGTVVVAAGTTDDLVAGFRGFVVDLRRTRTGVLLDPRGPGDGDLLGVRLSRAAPAAAPPGRGLLCVRGTTEPVQVALPDPGGCG